MVLAQTIISGLAAGSLYSMVALGLVIIFKATRALNFSYGQMAMLSAFFAFTLLSKLHLPYWAAFLLSLVFAALLATVIRNIIRPIKSSDGMIVGTMAMYMIMTAVAGIIWGWDPFPFPRILSGEPLRVFGLVISQNNVLIFAIAIVLMLLVYLFFKYTMIGTAMRSLSQNPVTTRLMGISSSMLTTATWVLSGVLAGVAGMMVAPTTYLAPDMMASFLMKTFVAAIFGGMTSYPGVVIGGLVLGVTENLVGTYVSSDLKGPFAFLFLVIILLIRPEGIMGKRVRMLGAKPSSAFKKPIDTNRPRLSLPKQLILIAAVFVIPFIFRTNTFLMYFINIVLIYMIIAIGLDVVTGYTGQLSMGHGAMVAIGAYTSALLTMRLGLPFWITIFLAGIVSALFGFLLGTTSLRLTGLFLTITTFGFGDAVPQILLKWDSLTNGFRGLKPPKPSIGAFVFDTDFKFYFIIAVVLIIIITLTSNFLRSKTGRALIALRDSEAGAEMVGINVAKYRILAFVISSFIAGIAGSLYAHMVGYVSPYDFNSTVSRLLLCMIIIGGTCSIPGAITGALLVNAIPQLLADSKNYVDILFGVTLLLFVIFLPNGFASIYEKAGELLKTWFGRLKQHLAEKS